MNQKKVLALLLSLCLIVSMTVPVFAAGSRGFSWPWTSSSATVEEEPATTSGGSLVLVEDETTVTEGTELRASTYVLTNDGSASSVSGDVYTEVDGSTTAAQLASSGETYYYLSDGVYYEVTITKSTTGFFFKRTNYTLTANGAKIATLSSSSKLSSAKITLYTKGAGVSAANEANAVSTMALTSDATTYGGTSSYASTTTIKYFPVTLYNYTADTINAATHQAEVNSGLGSYWNGIYFNQGAPAADSFTYTTSAGAHNNLTWQTVKDGEYYLDEACTNLVTVEEKTDGNEYEEATVTCNMLISSNKNTWTATGYYYTSDEENFYPLYAKRSKSGSKYTYTWGYSTTNSSNNVIQIGTQSTTSTGSTPDITVYTKSTPEVTGYQLVANGAVVQQIDNTDLSQIINRTLYSKGGTATTGNLPYAPHNFWTNKIFDGDDTTNADTFFDNLALCYNNLNLQVHAVGYDMRAGYVYSGLVQSNLDANKNIIFNYPEGGIFNSDTSVKDIYTNVGLPFDFDGETYTFDAQGNASAVFSGTPTSNTNLTKTSAGNFLPFGDWHFGMAATIPFTMTADGKLSSTNQKDIVFDFAGDDDVWVFIDGVLVLDMGGIHNSVSGSLNFAQNTTSISATTSSDGSGYLNTKDGAVSGTIEGHLFNDENGNTGILNQTLETFAAKESHELTIFYLERGAGVSNCKIQFNLPMKDSVSVHKVADKSKTSNGTVSELTDEEKTMVANTDFGFTLYKDSTVVANANYNLLNENGQYLDTRSTDSNGHFTLKAGQTAKFIGTIDATDGNTYYVVEDENQNFQTPEYSYTAKSANGYSVSDEANGLTSMKIWAKGSDEAEDSVVITCTNYLDAELPNPTSSPADDKIVIDYGLSVVISPLTNDVYKGSYSLTSVTNGEYGTATLNADGTITYQLSRQLTGVEVLTYTATATNGTDSIDGTANIYIIPATSMYYEENFTGLVTFTNGIDKTTGDTLSEWKVEGTAQTAPQEPGVVGTVGDSPYGSDAAYLIDNTDSNGSSKYVNTTNGAASFSYIFTGTGTSFFARTSGSTAMIKIEVLDKAGNQVAYQNRNTIYTSVDGTNVGTLYNIPVYTIDDLVYGTYTVNVTVLKAVSALKYGPDFYLDGIRVINPLFDPAEKDYNLTELEQIAQSAYATDGEANMTVATLREKLIGEAQINEDDTISWNEGDNFVVFTDTNGAITSAEEYKSNGPKEEVYLNNGQSVTFSLEKWDANTNKIYLGIKAPVGSGTVSINGNTLNINNATDCYYDISGYANITTDEDGVKTATFEIKATSSLISVTNIKVTGNAIFTIVNQEDIEV